jgi:hypothetical protein
LLEEAKDMSKGSIEEFEAEREKLNRIVMQYADL